MGISPPKSSSVSSLSSVCLQRPTHEHCQKEVSFISNMQLPIELHISANQLRQENHTRHYKAGVDQRALDPGEPIDIYHTIRKIWEPGNVTTRPNDAEPRTYLVERDGKQLQRTREHIRPRKAPMPRKLHTSITNPVKPTEPTTPTELEPTKPDDTTVNATPEPITSNRDNLQPRAQTTNMAAQHLCLPNTKTNTDSCIYMYIYSFVQIAAFMLSFCLFIWRRRCHNMYYSHGMFAHHKIVLTLYSYTRIYLYVTASCRLNRLFKAKLVQSSGRNDSINYRLIGRLGESMIEKFIID